MPPWFLEITLAVRNFLIPELILFRGEQSLFLPGLPNPHQQIRIQLLPPIPPFKSPCLALGLGTVCIEPGVVGWHRWRAVRLGACSSRRARSVVSYRSCSSSIGMPAYAASGKHKPLVMSYLRKLFSLKPFQARVLTSAKQTCGRESWNCEINKEWSENSPGNPTHMSGIGKSSLVIIMTVWNRWWRWVSAPGGEHARIEHISMES